MKVTPEIAAAVPEPFQQPNIAAIPTLWKGYWFRSRLEARWAVFFHHIGITFQYEAEGFRLENGTMYLPDFYLPQTRVWAEVKPKELSSTEQNKCELLAHGTRRGCMLLDGPPLPRGYRMIDYVGSVDIPTWATYNIDIQGLAKKLYTKEGRFWAEADPTALGDFSTQYLAAAVAARMERFERPLGTLPPIGLEPFNLDPKELMDAWR